MKTFRSDSPNMVYIYLAIGVSAIIVGIVNLYYKQYITAIAMAVVLAGQIVGYINWKKKQR